MCKSYSTGGYDKTRIENYPALLEVFMDAKKRKKMIDLADCLAGLLNTFWHCTYGNMNILGVAQGVGSRPINPHYWMEERFRLSTQCMGISMSKFGSLVVQVAHSPEAKLWATPFVDPPFHELKLSPYMGGVAYDTGNDEAIVGLAVSNLAGCHDQLIAEMLLAKYLDPTIKISRVSYCKGGSNFDFSPFVMSAQEMNVDISEQTEGLGEPTYVFHLESRNPVVGLEIAEFLATQPGGMAKPQSDRNFYIARSGGRTINGVSILGLTLHQS